MSLVTVAEYEVLTGKTVAPEDEARVQALLDAASAAVQGATGQTIEKARSEAERVDLDHWRQSLVLDEVPLIEGVDPDELVVTGPDGEVVPRDHYDVDLRTSTLKHCDCHPWAPGCYLVAYSHGYDPVPPDLQVLIVGAVSSVESGSGDGQEVASRSVGSYSVSYGPSGSRAGLSSVGDGSPVVERYRVPAPPMP